MENAVNALLIVAGVLIGVMILSLGVSLYSTLSGFVDESQQEIINKEVQQFNEQFFKYINWDGVSKDGVSPKVDFVLTIQDVVTAANAARNNNLEYGLDVLEASSESNYYVRVEFGVQKNLENVINSHSAQLLENGLDDQYTCTYDDIEISQVTGRVKVIKFTKISTP